MRAVSPSTPLLFVLSLICTFFTGFHNVEICSWLQPFFLLQFLHKSQLFKKNWYSSLGLLLVAIIAQANVTSLAFRPFFPGPQQQNSNTLFVGFIWSLLLWACLSIPFLVSIIYRKRFPLATLSNPFVFASLWTGVWHFWNEHGGLGAILSPGATQFQIQPLKMSSSIWGVDGITFLMAWFSALLHEKAVYKHPASKQMLKVQERAFGGVFLICLLYGSARVTLFSGSFYQRELKDTMAPTVPVSCILGNELFVYEDIETLMNRTRERVHAGDKLVLWSEESVYVHGREAKESLLAEARKVADHKAVLGVTYSYFEVETNLSYNMFDLVLPNGSIGFSYKKAHPVTFVEDDVTPGKLEMPFVDTELGRIGGSICFDFDFPDYIRQAGQKRVDLMLQPAATWGATGPRLYEGESFRGIENGFTWFRCSAGGISAIINPYNQIFDYREGISNSVFLMQLPVSARAWSFYPRYGYIFTWLFLVVAMVHLSLACLPLHIVKTVLRNSSSTSVLYFTGEVSYEDLSVESGAMYSLLA